MTENTIKLQTAHNTYEYRGIKFMISRDRGAKCCSIEIWRFPGNMAHGLTTVFTGTNAKALDYARCEIDKRIK